MSARLPFRLKLFIASALALIAVTVALTVSQATLVKRVLIEQLRGNALEQRPLLVAAFAGILAERDYASIQAIVSESVSGRGLAHLAVLDSRGNVVASDGWTPDMATTPLAGDETILGIDGVRRLPFIAEVRIGGQLLGSVHFGFSYEPVAEALRALLLRSIAVAGFCLVLTIAVVRALHARLMRPLADLARASEGIRRGDYDFDLAPAIQSDIADLAHSFRLMSEEIRRRIRSLSQSEEAQRSLLAEAMIRERDLSAVQRELADQAGKLERALSREREINQQQRRFVSVVSHEFRTPLTIIDGAAQRLARNADRFAPEDVRERVEKIRRAVARMGELIETTLSAARLDSGAVDVKAAEVDLNAMLTGVVERIRSIAAAFEITLDLPAAPAIVRGDARLLDQVLTNLLTNAVKYSGASRRIELVLRARDGQAQVSISDHGLGIPADELPKLFTRFFRASTASGLPGTGIGLNLARDLVAMHDGEITVASEVGLGSTFTVRLPLVPAAEQAEPVRAA